MQKVRITKKDSVYRNEVGFIISTYIDEYKKKWHSVKMSDYTRQSFKPSEVEIIKSPIVERKPEGRQVDTSMFLVGNSRMSNNMKRAKNEIPQALPDKIVDVQLEHDVELNCKACGDSYFKSERIGKPGKISHCPSCAEETIEKYRGVTIFSHKTCPDIEIKQGDRLIKEAGTFNYKGKT